MRSIKFGGLWVQNNHLIPGKPSIERDKNKLLSYRCCCSGWRPSENKKKKTKR